MCSSSEQAEKYIAELRLACRFPIQTIRLTSDKGIFEQVRDGLEDGVGAAMVLDIDRAASDPQTGSALLQHLNLSRTKWKDAFSIPIVFWVAEYFHGDLLRLAPDFFHWSGGTFLFPQVDGIVSESILSSVWLGEKDPGLPVELHRARIAELESRLSVEPANERDWRARRTWLLELASHYMTLAEYRKALTLLDQAHEIGSRSGDSDDGAYWNNRALILLYLGDFGEAEQSSRRALEIAERSFDADDTRVAAALNNLASLLQATNRLGEAEPLMRRALQIDEKSNGPDHPKVAIKLNNLAQLLRATNRMGEAEPLMRRALRIDEKSYGPDHPEVATDLNNLASLLRATNRMGEAEPLMRRALQIDEKSYGPDHPNVATSLNNLASLFQATNRLGEAEPLLRRALQIDEKSYGPDHPNVATRLNNLASLLQATNRLGEAEPLMRRAVQILRCFEAKTGHRHPNFETGIGNFASLLEALGRSEEEIRKEIQAVMEAEC
ncbi:MAG TPA: tetratricopeptide repeat protein [Fimbriimonadaceae bacterium]|nr:tetratricopeptide repeat protein [Fimbriimonadaceae bacterium]